MILLSVIRFLFSVNYRNGQQAAAGKEDCDPQCNGAVIPGLRGIRIVSSGLLRIRIVSCFCFRFRIYSKFCGSSAAFGYNTDGVLAG